jgi:hypothetical protein
MVMDAFSHACPEPLLDAPMWLGMPRALVHDLTRAANGAGLEQVLGGNVLRILRLQ